MIFSARRHDAMPRPQLNIRTIAISLFVVAVCVPAGAQQPAMVEFSALGKTQQGLPLLSLATEMVVLGRDGWMHSLNPRSPSSRIRKLEQPYQPISAAELRNELKAEFGRGFEVQATKNFLVVQPVGRGDRWPDLFESSHRAFTDYMRLRGVKVRNGVFPMVAIVLPDENAMYREFKKLDIDMKRVAGLYSGESNRVMTHDGGRSEYTAATVRHEAAHQSAYNSGVHSRLSETPRWITEGIGQMFEPAGMTDARTASRVADRVNQDSLAYIKTKFNGRADVRFTESVMQLVSDNSMFTNPSTVDEAYAVSWSMMFYLAERDSAKFAQLLNFTANRPPFRGYDRTERVNDFEKIIGMDILEFSRHVSWYVHSL
jgi:hypothetical protein